MRFCILILLLFPVLLKAQENQRLASDRPGQALSAQTQIWHSIQLQSGLNFNQLDLPAQPPFLEAGQGQIWTKSFLVRVGLAQGFELNAGFEHRWDKITREGNRQNSQGLDNFSLGMRFQVLDSPNSTHQLMVQTQLISGLSQLNNPLRGGLDVSWSAQWLKNWNVLTNVGLSLDYQNLNFKSYFALNSSFFLDAKQRVYAFVEGYGTFEDLHPNFDGGLAWFIIPSVQWDASFGWQGRDGLQDWFINTGLSWQFFWKRD